MKSSKLIGLIGVLTAGSILLAGCGVTLSPQSGASGSTGKLQVSLTDAPAKEEIEAVWLTVSGVSIHQSGALASPEPEQEQEQSNQTNQNQNENKPEDEGGWQSLDLIDDVRFDLLKLQGGLQAKLAMGDLAPGRYTQIRMDVTDVEIKVKGDDTLKEAKLPSNKLKFVHPFEIVQGQTTEIVFDFDALKSINVTGNGKYMCKPVIKLTTTKEPEASEGIEITTLSLPNGGVGTAYETATLSATGGTAPYTWSISEGTLPTGLIFDPVAGTISGTPTAAGEFTFTVKAEDSSTPVKKVATRSFTVNIADTGVLQITTTVLPDGTEGTAYPAGVSLKAIAGTGAYTWVLAADNNLPAGLVLDAATGVISGTPTAKGNYSFTIQVTDAAPTANTDSQVITIRINKAATP